MTAALSALIVVHLALGLVVAFAVMRRRLRRPPSGAVSAPAPPTAALTAPRAAVPWTRRPAVLAGGAAFILAFGVLLGVLAVRYTVPAPPAMGGMGSMPGMPGMPEMPGMAGAPGASDGGPAGSGAAPGTRAPLPPGALAGMLRAAHASLEAGRHEEAMAAYQAVLRRQPDNVEALSHAGLILAVVGRTDQALAALDRALALDPRNTHALWDKARVLQEAREDYAGAVTTWERFLALAPSGPDHEQAVIRMREAKARLRAPEQATGAIGGTMPGSGSKP